MNNYSIQLPHRYTISENTFDGVDDILEDYFVGVKYISHKGINTTQAISESPSKLTSPKDINATQLIFESTSSISDLRS
jgi:hypothetical protein